MTLNELFVDNFAGGGGASTGIEKAIGKSVDVAINHDPDAIAMHKVNHPQTKHYCEDVWQVDPEEACGGRPVALAWFSPDCKHFSRAKGGKPVDKNIRGLAWVAIKWALLVGPRVIMLENVPEIQTWCPLGKDNLPIRDRLGETFNGFVSILSTGLSKGHPAFLECCLALGIKKNSPEADTLSRGLGYKVEYRELLSCDYGAPTKRRRLYLIARKDGKEIRWPTKLYGQRNSPEVKAGWLKPWRSAAECIDWSIPMQSIFDRKKPLAEATCRRIARGIEKYVVNAEEPFIVNYKFDNAPESVNGPLSTITSVNSHYVCAPVLVQYHGETSGTEVRAQGLTDPIMTVDTSNRYGLVSAFIEKYYGEASNSPYSDCREPLHTVTTLPRHYLVAGNLIKLRNNCTGQSVAEPLDTVTAGGGHHALVESFLIKYYKQGENTSDIQEPLPTITAKDRIGIITIHGVDYQIVDIKMRMLQPHELFKAMGFPSDYVIDKDADGRSYPKSKQVARCGNAVTPPVATALVRANLPEYCSGNSI